MQAAHYKITAIRAGTLQTSLRNTSTPEAEKDGEAYVEEFNSH